MNATQLVCHRWLDKAFEAGQRCPRNSDQRSEYYSPLFEYEWIPKMLSELAAAAKEDGPSGLDA